MLDSRFAPVNVYLSAGSNIDPEQNLRMACRELEITFGELTLSSVYRNASVGFDGDYFLNMVVGFSSRQRPEIILARIERLHARAKRVRQENPFSSRTLDLDLLLYGNLVHEGLKLPHDDIEKYGFVIGPLAEVAPELRHPVSGKTMSDIWGGFDQQAHPMRRVQIGIAASIAA